MRTAALPPRKARHIPSFGSGANKAATDPRSPQVARSRRTNGGPGLTGLHLRHSTAPGAAQITDAARGHAGPFHCRQGREPTVAAERADSPVRPISTTGRGRASKPDLDQQISGSLLREAWPRGRAFALGMGFWGLADLLQPLSRIEKSPKFLERKQINKTLEPTRRGGF